MTSAVRVHHESGSTIVELSVAAGLVVLVLGMLGANALPALMRLEEVPQAQVRELQLVAAGDLVSRAVRGARPERHRPAMVGDAQELILAMGPEATVRFALVEGALVVDIHGPVRGMDGVVTSVLVSGLDMQRSSFVFFVDEGLTNGAPSPATAVALVLADDESVHTRVVRPRLVTHLDGPFRW